MLEVLALPAVPLAGNAPEPSMSQGRSPARRYAAYGGVYTVLEVLALPAVPLTMTAGLLFGVGPGAAVVSVSSTAAATISFLIARYAGAPPELAPLAATWTTKWDLLMFLAVQGICRCDL